MGELAAQIAAFDAEFKKAAKLLHPEDAVRSSPHTHTLTPSFG